MKCVSSGSHVKVANGSQKGWLKKSIMLLGVATLFVVATPQVQAIIPAGPPDVYSTDKEPTDLVTQLDFIKWLVNLTGDTPLFDSLSTVGDYVYWAKKFKMNPKGGWHPDDTLTQQLFAESLVDFYKIKSKKGQEIETLAREGITIPDQDLITWSGLVSVVDDRGFQDRLAVFSHLLCSPVTGKKHKLGTIDKCTPPPPPVGDQKKRKFRKFKEKSIKG